MARNSRVPIWNLKNGWFHTKLSSVLLPHPGLTPFCHCVYIYLCEKYIAPTSIMCVVAGSSIKPRTILPRLFASVLNDFHQWNISWSRVVTFGLEFLKSTYAFSNVYHPLLFPFCWLEADDRGPKEVQSHRQKGPGSLNDCVKESHTWQIGAATVDFCMSRK